METRDSIADIWWMRTPYAGEDRWPVRVDQRTAGEPDHWVQSACVLCSNRYGSDIGVKDGHAWRARVFGCKNTALQERGEA